MHSGSLPAAAGLAVGIGFIVLVAVFAPSVPLRNANAGFLAFTDCSQQPAAPGQAGQIELKERTWISVAKLATPPPEVDKKCVAVSQELLSKLPALAEALKGADGCAAGTEVCAVSYGISYPSDNEDYELSVTKAEAQAIAQELGISGLDAGGNAAILPYNNNPYLLHMYTAGAQDVSVQMEARFIEPVGYASVPLERDRSLNYTVAIRTWATYGGPVEINLDATSSARDSGLNMKFEPSRLVIPERSEATAKLVIRASPDAKDGIYEVRLGGRINNSLPLQDSPCKNEACPSVRIGSSEWTIENHGSDGIIGIGGRSPPEWLKATVETDKSTYLAGENVVTSAYLENDGAQAVVLGDYARLILTIYDDTNKTNDNVYTIDSQIFDIKKPIVIEPGSKILLAGAFQWDQKNFRFGVAPHDVKPGRYSVDMSFAGYNSTVFYAETRFTIGNASGTGTNGGSAYNGTATTIIIPQGVNGAEGNPPFYVPEEAHVKAGEEIRWKNEDGALHTATSATPGSDDMGKVFDTGIIPSNRFSQPVVIKDPGEYSYFCQLHPWMSGKIVVEPQEAG